MYFCIYKYNILLITLTPIHHNEIYSRFLSSYFLIPFASTEKSNNVIKIFSYFSQSPYIYNQYPYI